MPKRLADNLRDLFEVRNTFIRCKSQEEAIEIALDLASRKLLAQTASVFLFNKSGHLTRIKIIGVDKYRSPIPSDWFSDEEHQIGESFTGKVLSPGKNSDFGQPYWSNNLEREDIKANNRNVYLETLGALNCAIVVPLNGRNRTFGALEVINKLNGNSFTQDDVYWLSNIGLNLAMTISLLKIKNELNVLSEISQMLTEAFAPSVDKNILYENIAVKLVNPSSDYKACVIRLGTTPETLEVVARGGDEIVWDKRDDSPVVKSERLAWNAYITGEAQIVEDIKEQPNVFHNLDWINDNHLISVICLPLTIKGKSIGTFSIFAGYFHKFYPSDINFLESVASLVASFVETLGVINELHTIQSQLKEDVRATRSIGFNVGLDRAIHEHRRHLINIQSELLKATDSSPGRIQEILRTQIEFIEKAVKVIDEQVTFEIDSDRSEVVNISEIAKSLVRYYRLEVRNHINIILKHNPEIPLIRANGNEIKDIISNLISNAIKAIVTKGRKDGYVHINMDIGFDPIRSIEITVEDNGEGIRKEDIQNIFDANFSRYKASGKGTGLGLYITQLLVDSYGGDIQVTSSFGKGATFIVRIPLNRIQV
jgi:signal transduction histidine kinase